MRQALPTPLWKAPFLLMAALLAGAGLRLHAEDTKPAPIDAHKAPEIQGVEEYVKQLGSDDYDLRVTAMEELRDLGEKARGSLEKAAKGNDPQVAHSAMVLLKRINRATMEVKVLRPDGTPVPDVAVAVQLMEKAAGNASMINRRQESVQTDKQGLAQFTNVDPGSYYVTFRAQVPNFLPLYDTRRDHQMKVGVNAFELKLRAGSHVGGRMVDAAEQPVTGVKVVLARNYMRRYADKDAKQFARMLAAMPSKELDAQGAFAFDTVADSKYFVVVMKGDELLFKGDDFDVAEDKPVDLGVLKTKIKPGDEKQDPKNPKVSKVKKEGE